MTYLHQQSHSQQISKGHRVEHELKKYKDMIQKVSLKHRVWNAAWKLAFKFGKRTTIHGVNHLLAESAGKFERTIWLIICILATLGSVYVCLILSKRFSEAKFETVVDSTRMPVYRIHFPVVTICNLNRLNWQRLEEAKKRFLPNENPPQQQQQQEKQKLFERVLSSYDDISFANFEVFAGLKGEPLELLADVNLTAVVDFMSWHCEELLTQCTWNHMPIDCCEIFFRRRTKSGYCWAFNTLESDGGRRMQLIDSYWPWHNSGAGPTSGLNVRVLINPEKHCPLNRNEKGISVMITEPQVWHKDPFVAPENTQTMVEIEPVIYFYDNDTRSVSSDQRQCVFDDERNSRDFKSLQGYIYMIENCQSECHQEYLMRYCNCSLDLLFPPEYFRYSHQPGEEKYVRNHFQGMICKCFRNCYSLNYVSDVRPSFLPPEVRHNISYVDLDVHYRFETMMVYRTSLVFGWVDLMVAFGGIAGLFLGCSLLSAIELIYFVFVEIPSFIYSEIRQNRAKPMQQQHQQHLQSKQSVADLNNMRQFGLTNRIIAQRDQQQKQLEEQKTQDSQQQQQKPNSQYYKLQHVDYLLTSKLYNNKFAKTSTWNRFVVSPTTSQQQKHYSFK